MEQNKLISFALNFVSFLISKVQIDKAILYGSVANNTFDKDSDIDLFIETDLRNLKKIQSLLELYQKTKECENFRLEGVKNEISVKCGKLNEWKSLKRSIISNGIILYGKFNEQSEKLNHKILFIVDFGKRSKTEKIKLWRRIYGYKQKVGKKVYTFHGLAGRKVGRGAFICSLENLEKVKELFRKSRVRYELIEIWIE